MKQRRCDHAMRSGQNKYSTSTSFLVKRKFKKNNKKELFKKKINKKNNVSLGR